MKMLKVGIIGCGGISNSHMHGYLEMKDRVEVIACCDIDEPKAQEYAERYGIAHYYNNCCDMLKAEKLDLVSVCTWNNAHAECSIAALNAGCNVICEKPMAMNAKEAVAMKEAADRSGKLLMLGFVRRHGNDAQSARRLVENGELGEIYYAQAKYLRRCGFPGGWFGDKSLSGGGPLIDLGVHVIDLMRYIMGCPKPVSVFGATFDKLGTRPGIKATDWVSETRIAKPVFNVEDMAVAMIRFDNGAVLNLETSFNLNLPNNEDGLKLYGSKAGLSVSAPFTLYTEYDGQLADIALRGENDFNFHRDFDREIKNFVDAVEGKAECIAPAEDGVELMRILDAVYESAKTGKSVDIVR
ncbi:MAG: Gfo/Idh/MocA family oxidoreductase [Clostridia bacterium]|nr:Gfo/Idh/MocA family oxidoreductase [Clostridia bacterium]